MRYNCSGFYEFVAFITRIGKFHRILCIAGLVVSLAKGNQVIGRLNTWPAMVPIHGIVTADNGGKPTAAELAEFLFHEPYGIHGATGGGITAVEKGVQINLFCAALHCQFHHGMNMFFVAVHATG